MKQAVLWIVLFCCVLRANAQSDVSGYWEGLITQNAGGYRSEYKMKLFVEQKGKKVTGMSYVYVDNVHAEMTFEGKMLNKNSFAYKELEITKFEKLDNMEWCIKAAGLKLKRQKGEEILEGFWQGRTSFGPCVPGKIILRRKKPQV